jgi:hypothetical protein
MIIVQWNYVNFKKDTATINKIIKKKNKNNKNNKQKYQSVFFFFPFSYISFCVKLIDNKYK